MLSEADVQAPRPWLSILTSISEGFFNARLSGRRFLHMSVVPKSDERTGSLRPKNF